MCIGGNTFQNLPFQIIDGFKEEFKTAITNGAVKVLEAAGSNTAYSVFLDTDHMIGGEHGSEYKEALNTVQLIITNGPGELRNAGEVALDEAQKMLGSAGSPGVVEALKKVFLLDKDGNVSKGKVILISLVAASTILGTGFVISRDQKQKALIAAQQQQLQRQSQMLSQIHDRVVPQQEQTVGAVTVDDEPIQAEQINDTAKNIGLATLATGAFLALGYFFHHHNCSQ